MSSRVTRGDSTEAGADPPSLAAGVVHVSDLVGRLGESLATARAESDRATVALAKIYAADPLLRSLAVPRMRIGTVEFNVPVAMVSGAPAASPSSFVELDNTKLAGVAYRSLLELLEVRSLPGATSRLVRGIITRHVESLDLALRAGASTAAAVAGFAERVAGDLASVAPRSVPAGLRNSFASIAERQGAFADRVEAQLRHTALHGPSLPGVDVIVDARQLAELPTSAMGTVKIVFAETGVHVAAGDSGDTDLMLIPE